jgi:hypothetical protein
MESRLVLTDSGIQSARSRDTPGAFQRALGEIDGLSAAGTSMGFTELIRENFLFFPALRALADKRAQILEILIPGAMCRC